MYGGRLPPQAFDREAISARHRTCRRPYDPARAALPLQQPELLVSAVDRHRLRDRPSCASRSRRTSTSSRRGDPTRTAGAARPASSSRRSGGARCSCSTRRARRATSRASSAGSRRSEPTQLKLPGRRTADDAADSVRCTSQANPRQVGRVRDMLEQVRPPSSSSTRRSSATRRIRASRSRSPKATCPAATARRTSRCSTRSLPTSTVRLAQRSGELRELPDVLPRARARAPVVGTGGRLEELPRAVDQRGLRAVLRRAVRREGTRERDVLRRPAAADAALRRSIRRRRDRSISATGSATSAATTRSSARSSTTRAAMVLHMLRRLVGDEPFFVGHPRASTREWKFQKAGTDDFRHGDGDRRAGATCSASSRRGSTASDDPAREVQRTASTDAVRDGREFEQRGDAGRRADHRHGARTPTAASRGR